MKASATLSAAPVHRVEWVDYAKSIAIYLVVLLHVHCTPGVSKAINLFIMPAFFIMSGYLFSHDRNPSFGRFAWKRFRQLVVPYVWINLVAYIAWLTVLRHYGENGADTAGWSRPLVAMAAGIGPWLTHDIPLWSLLSFFVTEILYYPLRHKFKLHYSLIIALAWGAVWLGSHFTGTNLGYLPLTIGPSVCALGFYSLGNWWRHASLRLGWRQITAVAALSTVTAVTAFSLNGEVEFYICNYGGCYPLFLLGSLAGSALLYAAAMVLSRLTSNGKTPAAIRFISTGTLIICGFHLLVFALIKGVMLLGFGIGPQALTTGVVKGVLFATTAFLLTLPIVGFITRRLTFLVDKR